MEFIVSALFTSIVAAVATYWFNECSAKKRLKEKKIGILRAILTEVNALRGLIVARKRDFIIPDKSDILNYNFMYLPISYNYFTVYESRSAELGIIDNNELIDRVIRTYIETKGLFENIKDLDDCSRQYTSYIISDSYKTMAVQFIEAHHSYCMFILNQQAPMVENLLAILADELEKELSRIS